MKINLSLNHVLLFSEFPLNAREEGRGRVGLVCNARPKRVQVASVYRTDSIKLFTRVNTSPYKTENGPHSRNLFGFLTGFYPNFCNISNVNTVNEKRNIHWNVIFIELNIDREMLAVPLLQFRFCNEKESLKPLLNIDVTLLRGPSQLISTISTSDQNANIKF